MKSDNDQPAPFRSRVQVIQSASRDTEISHGAFRLWYLLQTHLNTTRGDSMVWPSYLTICEAIGCRPESITPWLAELQKSKWLKTTRKRSTKRGGHRSVNRYEILDGQGEPLLKVTTKNRSDPQNTVREKHYGKPYCSTTKNRSESLLKTVVEVDNSPKGVIGKEKTAMPSAGHPAKTREASGGKAEKKFMIRGLDNE